MVTEASWHLGGAVSCLMAAGPFWRGAPIGGVIPSQLLGVAAVSVRLRQYYGRTPPALASS